MQRYRLLLTVFLAAILLGKAIVGAAFPLLGAPGHDGSARIVDCSPPVMATAQQAHDAGDGPTVAADVDPDRLPLHATHDHSCPQLCMSGIDTPRNCWTADATSAGPIAIVPARSPTRLVRPPLHPPRAGLGA